MVLPVKVFDQTREQDPTTIAKAIECAIDHGVQIINLSLAVPNGSTKLNQTILKAIHKNIPVIASAGNDGRNELPFPANMEPVISGIARDMNNVDVAFSNYSTRKKSVSAPGAHIKVVNNHFVSGTSFATAFVTGTIALMKSSNKDIDIKNIQEALYNTSIDGKAFSYGLIQADRAISQETKKLLLVS